MVELWVRISGKRKEIQLILSSDVGWSIFVRSVGTGASVERRNGASIETLWIYYHKFDEAK